MQKETKKKLGIIGASFLGGILVTLLVVWLTALACPCKKRHPHSSMRRPSIERPADMQGGKRVRRIRSSAEARPEAPKGQPIPAKPLPAPEKAQ